jgi:hypothetical protein
MDGRPSGWISPSMANSPERNRKFCGRSTSKENNDGVQLVTAVTITRWLSLVMRDGSAVLEISFIKRGIRARIMCYIIYPGFIFPM